MDYRGWPVAALSVAGPEHRVGLADLGRATAEAARELSTRLGYSPRVASAGS
jgi:IclR family acetate operon transcriptional repressor